MQSQIMFSNCASEYEGIALKNAIFLKLCIKLSIKCSRRCLFAIYVGPHRSLENNLLDFLLKEGVRVTLKLYILFLLLTVHFIFIINSTFHFYY